MDYIDILKDIVLPLSSLMVAVISIIVAMRALKGQKIHNKNSVKPIIQLRFGDYEDRIFVSAVNRGVGPGIVKNMIITNEETGEKYDHLIDIFGDSECTGWPWSMYNKRLKGIAIRPGISFTLIKMNKPNEKQKAIIRKRLCALKIHFEYTDIYGQIFKNSYGLEFFGRYYENSNIKKKIICRPPE
ncbi:MAG: hypothetical protein FWF69_01995 [Firmicutes bacterium]|nr:hypothetical protein [Bacillota bacterium]